VKIKYVHNGKEVTREEFDALPKNDDWLQPRSVFVSTCRENNPRRSESMGVLPNQVPEALRILKKWQRRGELSGVRIRDNGSVEYTSNGEQGAIGWQRLRGDKVNADGGYSDTYTPDQRFGD
jgi:hypothetical protein